MAVQADRLELSGQPRPCVLPLRRPGQPLGPGKAAAGLTPQQVCDALGSPKASNLFVIAGYMQLSLYQIDPAGLGSMVSVPAGYTATINADGTVTITYSAPAATPTPSPTP